MITKQQLLDAIEEDGLIEDRPDFIKILGVLESVVNRLPDED